MLTVCVYGGLVIGCWEAVEARGTRAAYFQQVSHKTIIFCYVCARGRRNTFS